MKMKIAQYWSMCGFVRTSFVALEYTNLGSKTLQTKTIAIENSTYMLTKVMVKVGLNYNFDRYDLIAVVIQHLGPLH